MNQPQYQMQPMQMVNDNSRQKLGAVILIITMISVIVYIRMQADKSNVSVTGSSSSNLPLQQTPVDNVSPPVTSPTVTPHAVDYSQYNGKFVLCSSTTAIYYIENGKSRYVDYPQWQAAGFPVATGLSCDIISAIPIGAPYVASNIRRRIESAFGNVSMDVFGDTDANGAGVGVWLNGGLDKLNQLWRYNPTTKTFTSEMLGRRCLTNDPQSGAITIANCSNEANQQWELSGSQLVSGGKCAGLQGNTGTPGAPIFMQTCSSAEGQKWALR